MKKELLSIIFGLERLHKYVYDRQTCNRGKGPQTIVVNFQEAYDVSSETTTTYAIMSAEI